jgi:predicted dithiol-disulfide oxidoreductase (DUF899 family)
MAMPWVRVEKAYEFEGPDGTLSLADLFAGRSQLIVYHFMFAPDWNEGCKSCSFWADSFDGTQVHLAHRDVTFTAVSRAPLSKLIAYKERMGWEFPWVSTCGSAFSSDYQVYFAPRKSANGCVYHNYQLLPADQLAETDEKGISVFFRDERDVVYHTYSCYMRGIDAMNTAYQLLDLVPNGRDEDGLRYPMEWLRRHDKYQVD